MTEPRERTLAVTLLRNLAILGALTLVFLVTLALAPLKWQNTEWRDIQREYNRRATEAGVATMNVRLQQVWRPEIGLTDRCATCHLGMGSATPLESGGSLFERHPEVGHDVARMGCTVCHRGQGRATTMEAAHGDIEHWNDPMLPAAHLQASCGTCHGESARVPSVSQVERGAYLFQLHGCQACHRVDGEGPDIGPDLSGVALKGFDREWHIQHLRSPTSMVEGSQMMSFGHLRDEEIDDILTYLDTLIGAPRLVRGKAIAVGLGCRGCHTIGGLGGDLSDLDEVSQRKPGDYDFTYVQGPHTIENWHREHLRDPTRVAPGSTMPPYVLPTDDEDALITYLLSLRQADLPLDQLPRETLLARMQERRDFASDPESLYRTFCSACHGAEGRGQVLPALGTTVPDLRNPEVHTILSAESMRHMIETGRPGRNMPAWNQSTSGVSPEELTAIINYLRDELPSPPAFDEVQAARPDLALGALVFGNDCASCHGPAGSGTEIAPGLRNPEFQFVADDRFLYTTIALGRSDTAMPAHPTYAAATLASVIAWIRSETEGRRAPAVERQMTRTIQDALSVENLDRYRASGSPAYGRLIYESMCVSCHGDRGRGSIGPAIANPAFLRVATDGFLAGTIVLGRSQRAMRSFGPHGVATLEGREIGDVITYIRQLGSQRVDTPGYRTVQGTPTHGRELFGQYCVGCHGPNGEGLTGPALRNPAFLDAVSDGFLQATIVRGRPGTAMRAWARGRHGFAELEPQDINDIVAHIRSWQTSR